jgi:alanine racemase
LAKIVINKSHLFHNLQQIEEKINDKNKIAVVLKDNAYGHGLLEIAQLCSEYGVRNAVVRTLDEAQAIVTFFDNILILADTAPDTYSHTFHIAINSLEALQHIPKNSKIQLKVDSGMHRNGLSLNKLEKAFLGACKRNLVITGVFTHYRSADELGSEYFWQKQNFKHIKEEVKRLCEKLFLPIPSFHSANSSAVFRDNFCMEDMVRVGIALYGYLDTNPIFNNPVLKPVLSLYANKISTREVCKNQRIGYGGTAKIPHDMKISTYDIGYGDGFLRLNERKKYHTPEGFEVLGRVSMDNLSLNSTQEEVCLFNDVTPLAQIHDTITYEILTSLKPTIPRIVI